MNNLPYIILIFTSFAGFLLSLYIYHKKREKKPMVCPLKSDCNAVINSQFSSFFGIPLEILGLIYYSTIAITYGTFLALPNLISSNLLFVTLSLTTIGFFFSIYLIFIQAFAIKQWCVWCLTSASLCGVIFLTTILGSGSGIIQILQDNLQIILTLNLIGLALGVGGITIYDILFIKFLRDLKIASYENEILKTISQIIWLAIFIFTASGIGLITKVTNLNTANQLSISLIILLIIIVNEVIINIFITPKLIDISFGKRHIHAVGELHRLRKLSIIVSIISFISWYSLLIIMLLPTELEIALSNILLLYILVLLVGFTLGFLLERKMGNISPTIAEH